MKPVLLMLLSRHPYAEKSGRGFMLRQRIEQAGRRFETRLVVMGHPADDASDAGITFLPMAGSLGIAANAIALADAPMQTWLYNSATARVRVAEMAAGAAAIYIDMLRLAPLAEDAPKRVARVIDYDDLLSERYRLAAIADDYDVMGFLARRFGPFARLARFASRPLLRAEATRCAKYERAMAEAGDLILFTSPREAEAFAGPHVMAAPPMLAPATAVAAPGRRLIFLGNMRYAENVTMLRALAEGVRILRAEGAWPADAVIEAVGDHAEDLPGQFDDAFRFVGRIADLGALAGAGIFLAPVTSGSGVKIKVLDGMALSCPVVATPKALEGLSARANRDLIIARTPTDVLRAALKLLDKPRLKAMLAARARTYLERAHSSAIGDTLCDAIEAAIKRRQETL